MSDPTSTPPEPSRQVQLVAFEPRYLRNSVMIVLGVFVGYLVLRWLFESVGHFLFILLLAFLWAIAMEPIVRRLAARGWRRGAATGLVIGLLFLIGLVFSLVFGGLFAQQVAALVENLPNAVVQSVTWINATFHTTINPNDITAGLNITPGRIAEIAGSFAGGLLGFLGSVVGGVFDAVTCVVFAFYLSADNPRLRRVIGSWLPAGQQRVFLTVWDIAVVKTGGFVISKVVLATLSAVAHSIAFAVIGVPYWLPMGILAGITSQFIPTIGTYIGILIPAVFSLADGQTLDVVWIVIFATIYQQFENYVLMPRISRWTMNMHPAVALASVFVGIALFGPIGALIGMPIMAAVLAVIETYGRRYELIPEMHAATIEAAEEPESESDDEAVLAEARKREHELDAQAKAQEELARVHDKAERAAEKASRHDA